MISVIIPVYNGEDRLGPCLDSLLAQTYKEFEAVIVDNMSTDSTSDIITDYSRRDARFHKLSCEQAGVSYARNAGMDAAQGNFIFFLDADDTLMPHALERMAGESDSCDIVIPNILRVSGKKSAPMDSDSRRILCAERGVLGTFAAKLPTYLPYMVFKMYRTDMLRHNGIRFDPSLSLGEDLLFNLSAFEHAARVCFLGESLYTYYAVKGGLNTKYRPDMIEIKTMLHHRLKHFLNQHGLWEDQYYQMLLNDVFAMMANTPTRSNIRRILSSECCRELAESKVERFINLQKRVILFCIRQRLITPLLLAARIF